jgi:hypothetical protein
LQQARYEAAHARRQYELDLLRQSQGNGTLKLRMTFSVSAGLRQGSDKLT